MKHTDSLMPYLMASMHPVLHIALLTTALMLPSIDHKKFFDVPDVDKCTDPTALKFITDDKFKLLRWM